MQCLVTLTCFGYSSSSPQTSAWLVNYQRDVWHQMQYSCSICALHKLNTCGCVVFYVVVSFIVHFRLLFLLCYDTALVLTSFLFLWLCSIVHRLVKYILSLIVSAMIGGAVLVLLCLVLVVMFVVYRMRKKDEGSYALCEEKKQKFSPCIKEQRSASIIYTKAAANDECFA